MTREEAERVLEAARAYAVGCGLEPVVSVNLQGAPTIASDGSESYRVRVQGPQETLLVDVTIDPSGRIETGLLVFPY